MHLPVSGELFQGALPSQPKLSQISGLVLNGVLCLYLGSILFAMGRLTLGLWRTRTLVHHSFAAGLSDQMQRTWQSSLEKFDRTDVELMSTISLSGPATLSWPSPLVLLPADLENEEPNEMAAVFCHELAHVSRNDFIWNVVTEILGVALFYHPAFHWMRRRIQETRELACDDMAAEVLSGRHLYARNLLSLTQKMLTAAAIPQPGCALGIFEGEVLERRIMNLLKKPSQHPRLRAVSSAVFGCCLVFATCALSASFGLKLVQAQSAAPANHAPSGWFLAGSKPANYQTGVDHAVVENGQPSAFLKSAVPTTDGFGTLMQSISANEYAGKRVRLRAWVRSQDVADWAGVWMRVDKGSTSVAFDNMQNRPIKGDQSWETCDVVLDVPQNATGISFGVLLSKTGEVWMSDLTFEIVGNEVPTTNLTPNQAAPPPNRPANLNFTE
jgi:beta-lactamase regulating signal transducer with metallopeptidase domain